MQGLPPETQLYILLFLDKNALHHSTQVCTLWTQLIKSNNECVWRIFSNRSGVTFSFLEPDSEETLSPSFMSFGHGRRATLTKLIEKITDDKDKTLAELSKSILLTVQYFTSIEVFMDGLIQRYDDATLASIKLNVLNFILNWIEYWRIFQAEKKNHGKYLTLFLNHVIATDKEEECKSKALEILNVLAIKISQNSTTEPNIPASLPEVNNNDMSELDFLKLDPSIIASQIALIDREILESILPQELFRLNWNKSKKDTLSPNVLRSIKYFNQASCWISTAICSYEKLNDRVAAVTQAVAIVSKLYELQDFGGVMSLLAGLYCSAVYRLRKTRKRLDDATVQNFTNISNIMSHEASYMTMREAYLRACKSQKPFLPYLGLFLTDLTFIEEGSSDRTAEGLINLDKCRLIATSLQGFYSFYNLKYCITVDPTVRNYLMNSKCLTEENLYKVSLKLEPRKKKNRQTVLP